MTSPKSSHPTTPAEKKEAASPQNPPKGFGKGINDYLNQYVTVSDAKAAAFLVLNFLVIQFLVEKHFWMAWGFPCHWAGLGFLLLSIFAASAVLFPRLPRGSKGLIFWEDICERDNPREYEKELAAVQENRVEQEYAHQNFYVSNVLHKKMRLVQWEIILFFIGAAFTVLCIAGHSYASSGACHCRFQVIVAYV